MNLHKKFDVIVVGGGHAGTEAALASARMGRSTLLITHNSNTLGAMSCNPAIGGIGKSHLVKEIDALGGIMAMAADVAGIQFRVLNASKGAAVRATRAQADRALYRQFIRYTIENQKNLLVVQDAVDDILITNNKIHAVVTKCGLVIDTQAVVLTAGTFLNGQIHIGEKNFSAGRAGDPSAIMLANRLRELPFNVSRLKTGTPARLDSRTIDFSKMQTQPGDDPLPVFSFLGDVSQHPKQVYCHITHTNEKTHDIIRAGIDKSPMFSGRIKGVGPRYCPSIEDKVYRFADKTSHQIFLEPESLHVNEVYPNGISTSLDIKTQFDFIRSIQGLENVHIIQFGYAIEYDFFDPRDLKDSLETKFVEGLFFAGQINGTTGYEEAAGQGLIAGLNAALKVQEKDAWTPRRSEAYIGVLIDDLIMRGTSEPYRMFTSRAEYRLMLREDNADLRLTEIGRKLGLVDDYRWQIFSAKRELIAREQERLKATWIKPDSKAGENFAKLTEKSLAREYSLMDLLKRPEINYESLVQAEGANKGISDKQVAEQIEIQAKYLGYIERQELEVARLRRYEETKIPPDFDYDKITALSHEVRQKLKRIQPVTVGAAGRISGVTPAAISLLLIFLKR